MHKRVHDDTVVHRFADKIIVKSLAVTSRCLGLTGYCDIVEFHRDDNGHLLAGETGLWSEFPVEYKHGRSKDGDEDRVQLCAEAMCLEEMLASEIHKAYLFYGKTKKREEVRLDNALRSETARISARIHECFARGYIPKAGRRRRRCRACSLETCCMPEASISASGYLKERIIG